MKKKVALLLAFIMVLSLLPMNLFGATDSGLVVTDLAPRVPTATTATTMSSLEIAFPATGLSGLPIIAPHILRIRLVDGNTHATQAPGFETGARVASPAAAAAVTFTEPTANPQYSLARRLNEAAAAAEINAGNVVIERNEIRILLEAAPGGADDTLPTFDGFLRLNLGDVRFRGNDAAIIVEVFPLANPAAVTVLSGPHPLVEGAIVQAVDITADDPVEMRTYLLETLPDITISEVEGGIGVLAPTGAVRTTSNQALRITLPTGFNFVANPTLGGEVSEFFLTEGLGTVTASTTVKVFAFEAERRSGALATTELLEIAIEDLKIIANVNTEVEEVEIFVELGWFDTGRLNNTHRGFHPNPTGLQDRRGSNFTERVVVATRAERIGNVIGEGEDEDDLEPVRSGAVGSDRAEGTVRFSDTTPGLLLAGSPLFELRITSPGVTFANMTTTGSAPAGLYWGTAKHATEPDVTTAEHAANRVFPGSGLLPAGANPTRFVIRPSGTDLRADASGLAALEIDYVLNIPAGWVARTGYTQVLGDMLYNGDVIASGIVLAEVYDPIYLVAAAAIPILSNDVGMLGLHQIPDIVIRETEVGALGTGEVWVQLLVVSGGNVRDLGAANRPYFTVGGVAEGASDMVVSTRTREDSLWGRMSEPGQDNPGWRFNIDSQSTDYPAEIVLSGIEVSGGFAVAFPGLDIELVVLVGGPAVTGGHYVGSGWEAAGEPPWPTATAPRGMSRTSGYAVTVATTGQVGIGVVGVIPDVPPFTWGAGTAFVANRAPFRLIGSEGMANPRAFAYQIGGTTSFCHVTNVATVTGVHQQTGHIINVQMGFGRTTMRIDNLTLGITTEGDIASFINRPYGSSSPQHYAGPGGGMMLPVRVLADVFGFRAAWDAATMSATFTSRR